MDNIKTLIFLIHPIPHNHKVGTLALDPTVVPTSPVGQAVATTLVQGRGTLFLALVQEEGTDTLVLDPTSTMVQDQGTLPLPLVLTKDEVNGSGITWARAGVWAGVGGQDKDKDKDKDRVEGVGPTMMWRQKIGRIFFTTSQWWKTLGSF